MNETPLVPPNQINHGVSLSPAILRHDYASPRLTVLGDAALLTAATDSGATTAGDGPIGGS